MEIWEKMVIIGEINCVGSYAKKPIMKQLLSLLLTIVFFSTLQGQNKPSPADKALAAIEAIKNYKAEIKLSTRLACLTQIFPKHVDLNYFGVCYKPTNEELEMWRNWILKNEDYLEYEKQEPEGNFDFIFGDFNIIYNDKKGLIRNSYCQ
ncbi:MAG: hypothetical protein KGZ81_16215 [Flavobacteriales bacterium]|nr:hypothetical protein [Flavobacteriales bacterium]